jgi:hypothetical protein
MPADGAIIFGDLIGKLDMLRIQCPKRPPHVNKRRLYELCAASSADTRPTRPVSSSGIVEPRPGVDAIGRAVAVICSTPQHRSFLLVSGSFMCSD